MSRFAINLILQFYNSSYSPATFSITTDAEAMWTCGLLFIRSLQWNQATKQP